MARALDEVGAVLERVDEAVHLARIGAAVGVDHHDDLARGRREAGAQRGALAAVELVHDDDVRTRAAREDSVRRSTGRRRGPARDPLGQILDHPQQAALLVQRRDHNADGRPIAGAPQRSAIILNTALGARAPIGGRPGGASANALQLTCPQRASGERLG